MEGGAEQAEWLDMNEFIPVLTKALAVEKDGKTKRSLEHSLRMLRDGYILDRQDDGTYSFWTRTSDGHGGRYVTEAELNSKGIDAIVREFRMNHVHVAR